MSLDWTVEISNWLGIWVDHVKGFEKHPLFSWIKFWSWNFIFIFHSWVCGALNKIILSILCPVFLLNYIDMRFYMFYHELEIWFYILYYFPWAMGLCHPICVWCWDGIMSKKYLIMRVWWFNLLSLDLYYHSTISLLWIYNWYPYYGLMSQVPLNESWMANWEMLILKLQCLGIFRMVLMS